MNYKEELDLEYPVTPQQKIVFDWVINGKGNAVLKAVAGGGKTTVLEIVTKILKKHDLGNAIYLAFNKAIVNEANEKLNCEVSTLHSKGLQILRNNFGNIKVDAKYVNGIINEKRKGWIVNKKGEIEPYAYGRAIMELISKAKMSLLTPDNCTFKMFCMLMEKFDIDPSSDILDTDGKRLFYKRFIICYKSTLPKKTNKGYILRKVNFDDMVFLPVYLKGLTYPQYNWVLIDECQDLNAAQREFMLRLVSTKNGRFLSVGDEMQAIYKFSGADADSYKALLNLPNTVELNLTKSFRCGKNIITEAQTLVPYIEAFESNGNGSVIYDGSINNVKNGDIVLCRINAPLVELCLQYIVNGQKAIVRGRDIGTNLIALIRKLKVSNMYSTKSLKVLEQSLEIHSAKMLNELAVLYPNLPIKILKSFDSYTVFQDKHNAITAISTTVNSVASLINKITEIFQEETDGILLSSIHKSKGLEFKNVFLLHRELFGHFKRKNIANNDLEAAQQEDNLHYVAITRAIEKFEVIRDWSSNSKLIKSINNELESNQDNDDYIVI